MRSGEVVADRLLHDRGRQRRGRVSSRFERITTPEVALGHVGDMRLVAGLAPAVAEHGQPAIAPHRQAEAVVDRRAVAQPRPARPWPRSRRRRQPRPPGGPGPSASDPRARSSAYRPRCRGDRWRATIRPRRPARRARPGRGPRCPRAGRAIVAASPSGSYSAARRNASAGMPLTRAISSSSSSTFTLAYMYWAPGGALTAVDPLRPGRAGRASATAPMSQTPRSRSISSTSRSPLVIERRWRMVSAPPGETVRRATRGDGGARRRRDAARRARRARAPPPP